MSKKSLKFSQKEKNLIRRYLVWCYKTTKEELDKTDRYFTQWEVDNVILKQLKKSGSYYAAKGKGSYAFLVDDFEKYMKTKHDNALTRKYTDIKAHKLNPSYEYLDKRLVAIEAAIVYFLGKKELAKIISLYEIEMTTRILQARDH